MAQSQFSLLWNAHKKNICHGLSALQQNGEFVDMTLAADGHMVKVHQVIVALASPYIKELISSAQCPHPVIFLNKISYSTLCYLLEYVYTGEVLVSIENLSELLEAGKELHVKGFEDMNLPETISLRERINHDDNDKDMDCKMEGLDEDVTYFEIVDYDKNSKSVTTDILDSEDGTRVLSTNLDVTEEEPDEAENDYLEKTIKPPAGKSETRPNPDVGIMQFTVSNQGSLQMILNRYIYYLKHTNRNNTRQWRCVDYINGIKCPAHVFTKDDVVVQRISAHVHPFHDKKILKKVKAGAVFTEIHEAEQQRKTKKH